MRIVSGLNIGGPAIQALLLTRAMRERGHETLLVAGGTPDDERDVLPADTLDPHQQIVVPQLRDGISPLQALQALRALMRLMRSYQPQVVHTQDTTASLIGRLAARLTGVPVVVHTLHTHPFRGYYSRLSTFLFIWQERLGAYLSDSIVTLSEGLRRELIENYGITSKKRLTVLPLGLDLSPLLETPRHQGTFRAAHGIPDGVPLIGIVGRLVPVKNHRLFLQAAARIVDQQPDARFVIIGDGPLKTALYKEVGTLGLGDRVIFTGWVSDVAAAYSDLDVLTVSSHNEGTPIPVIEALAAGCPVVATRVGGLPDLVDGGRLGLLVPPGDAAALADTILKSLHAPPPDTHINRSVIAERYSLQRLSRSSASRCRLYRGHLIRYTTRQASRS